ncbi:hypothetical protein KY290_024693 [Solanum tuberosum]|uniref:Uncharacterized protein n=1 Tax=Solanum tuberosum TaxID=4113 RepID=A0ABQ7USL2_SOLTU|nr:hypothetical protein KY284_023542 [Solanum tuberosum]KAH0754423.1 hypothetical protein KY290_024693 [Solanum tuberosum]
MPYRHHRLDCPATHTSCEGISVDVALSLDYEEPESDSDPECESEFDLNFESHYHPSRLVPSHQTREKHVLGFGSGWSEAQSENQSACYRYPRTHCPHHWFTNS